MEKCSFMNTRTVAARSEKARRGRRSETWE
jgi:reactive chlorine resistance protein C